MLPLDFVATAVLTIAVPDAVAYSQPPQAVSDAAVPVARPPRVRPPAARTAHLGRILSRWGWVHVNTYFGPGYDARFEPTRECVDRRESDDTRTEENAEGYSGFYQFGLPWTRTLQHWTHEYVAIRWMSVYAQDKAWWLAFDHGAGAGNWAGGRWPCPGVPY